MERHQAPVGANLLAPLSAAISAKSSPRKGNAIYVAFTDAEKTFVTEAGVYRILKAQGLVTSPAFIVMKAVDRIANPTTAINQLWQIDFTYLKVTVSLTSTSREVIASGNGARRSSDAPSSRDANSTSTQQHELQPDGQDSP